MMRFIVVGLGNIGEKRRRLLGPRCVATVDPYHRGAAYASHRDVPEETYDAVVLATPNDVKLEYLASFLGAGKHVIVEKPLLFPDPLAAQDLARSSRETGAVWYTAYNHRFEPHIVEMKRLLGTGFVGELYRARLFYGNGTVQNIVGSWREGAHGVLEDLGCHLIDLAHFLLGHENSDFKMHDAQRLESRSIDHAMFSTRDDRIWLECSWVEWKNTFKVDVLGSRGSIHLNGLGKWGPSELITRRRVLPSGVPEEELQTYRAGDTTWQRDVEEFERRVQEGRTSLESDERISTSIYSLAGQVGALPDSVQVG
jgi:predicted dehydrogenase